MMARLVAVKCKLYAGIFASERIFEVPLANGDVHRGVAPRHFCWNSAGKIVEEDDVTEGIDGSIAARRVPYSEEIQEGIAVIEVPDGEVLAVKELDVLTTRPTKITPPEVEVF